MNWYKGFAVSVALGVLTTLPLCMAYGAPNWVYFVSGGVVGAAWSEFIRRYYTHD